MKIISLGGVGGCIITQAVQKFIYDQERYPYDWLLANQSFVIRTLLDNSTWFDFEDETEFHHNNYEFSIKERDGMIVHDFSSYENYKNQRNTVKETYKRRFDRLNQIFQSNEPIMFVRITNNTPMNDNWIGRFESVPDDIPKWFDFIQNLEQTYKKPVYLCIVTMNQTEYGKYKDRLPNTGRFFMRMYDNSNVNGNEENITEFSKLLHEVFTDLVRT